MNRIAQGLSLASYVKVMKMFADYISYLKNTPMQSVVLTGLVLKQISTFLETVPTEYILYSLSIDNDMWTKGRTNVHKAFIPASDTSVAIVT